MQNFAFSCKNICIYQKFTISLLSNFKKNEKLLQKYVAEGSCERGKNAAKTLAWGG